MPMPTSADQVRQASARMRQVRVQMLLTLPFYGTAALRLDLQPSYTCPIPGITPTMWTDGKTCWYNPEYVETATDDELIGVLAHEVTHCLGGHPWRRGARDPLRWNLACDYAINGELEQAGLVLPGGRLRDLHFDGQSAEWIYLHLPPTATPPGAGLVIDGPTDDAFATPEAWQQMAAAAAAQGTLPAHLQRRYQTVAPVVNWRALLLDFVQRTAAAWDYTWRRPHRRWVPHGLYLPSLDPQAEVGPLAVAVDTSGSITGPVLDAFVAELTHLRAVVRTRRLVVLWADAAVHRMDILEADDPLDLQPVGGGGTDFRAVFSALRQLDEPPVCVIYLTDLDGTFPEAPPDLPVLWATTPEHRQTPVPFGDVVVIEG